MFQNVVCAIIARVNLVLELSQIDSFEEFMRPAPLLVGIGKYMG